MKHIISFLSIRKLKHLLLLYGISNISFINGNQYDVQVQGIKYGFIVDDVPCGGSYMSQIGVCPGPDQTKDLPNGSCCSILKNENNKSPLILGCVPICETAVCLVKKDSSKSSFKKINQNTNTNADINTNANTNANINAKKNTKTNEIAGNSNDNIENSNSKEENKSKSPSSSETSDNNNKDNMTTDQNQEETKTETNQNTSGTSTTKDNADATQKGDANANTQQQESSNTSTSISSVFGLIGAIIGIALIGFVGVFYYKKKKQNKNEFDSGYFDNNNYAPTIATPIEDILVL